MRCTRWGPRLDPKTIGSAITATLLAVAVTAGCAPKPTSDGLALGNQVNYVHCLSPQKGGRDWADLQAYSTQIGIDDLVLVGDQPVTVTKAELVPRGTRLKLTGVLFVPLGNSVGSGARFADAKAASDQAAWAKRLLLPARLTSLHPSAALKEDYPGTANQWQVVVGVQPTGENDTADAIALTYTVGDRTKVLVGRNSFGVARTTAACTKDFG
jgi:hypothetical protein